MSKPPLGLHVEVTDANGVKTRWDADSPDPALRPQGLSFSTQRGNGFGTGSCSLSRRIDRDYVDLNLYDDFAFVGYDGSVAYEGRLGAMPRSLDTQHTISVQLAGWMAHAKDKKFSEIYVDRAYGSWGDMSLAQKVNHVATNNRDIQSFSWSTDRDGLVAALPNQALGAQVISETWYEAPTGVTVAKVMYTGADSALPAGWLAPTVYATDDDNTAGVAETYGLTFDSTLRTQSLTTARRYLALRHHSNGTASTPAAGSMRRVYQVGVYGSHGLTTRTIDSSNPDGLYASDVISNIVSRFCPKLNANGVLDTTYAIPHLVFRERTTPFDAFLEINKHHLWELAVWEDKTLHFYPHDLSDYDWEVRTDDPGTSFDLQGDSTDEHFNGIVVQFTNVSTGRQEVLTPDDTSALADTNPENPATLHGIDRWDEISLSSPTTSTAAAEIGRAALAERNQPKAPGSIRVTGHIKDRAGHWTPVWKVRAGDTIAVTNHPNDRPRLVTETNYNHDDRTVTISVDSETRRLDAVLDRISTALSAANIS
jgi:hypothetical protein